MALRNLLQVSKQVRSLLEKKASLLWTRIQPTSNLTPMGGGFGSLFKLQTIKDNIDVAPVIGISFITVAGLVFHVVRTLITIEDISYVPGRKMKSQKHRYICEGAKPQVIKYMVVNQKYEWPMGLLDALCEEKDDEKCKKPTKKLSFRFWKKDKEPDMDGDDEE